MPIEVKGARELGEFFAECPNLGREATRAGLVKASARLRTLIRRAAPMKSGTLKKSIGSWVSRKSPNPTARIGLKTRYYYKTLEYGRRSYVRKSTGKNVKGSPEMARFAFLWKAISAHEKEFLESIITESRSQFYKVAGRAAARMGAPIKVRG